MEIQPQHEAVAASASPPVVRVPAESLAASSPQTAPTPDQVREAVKEIQQSVANNSTSLQFSVDSATGRTIVSIIDAETREIVRQIPTEEIMKLARALDRMGLLVNGKA